MSASAPLGSPSRNTGIVAAVCTSATITGDVVSEVISHAAATSFIDMHALAVTQTIHSVRNTGSARGANAAVGSARLAGSGVFGDGSVKRGLLAGSGRIVTTARATRHCRSARRRRPPRELPVDLLGEPQQRRAIGLRRQRVAEAPVDPVERGDAAVAVEIGRAS